MNNLKNKIEDAWTRFQIWYYTDNNGGKFWSIIATLGIGLAFLWIIGNTPYPL